MRECAHLLRFVTTSLFKIELAYNVFNYKVFELPLSQEWGCDMWSGKNETLFISSRSQEGGVSGKGEPLRGLYQVKENPYILRGFTCG